MAANMGLVIVAKRLGPYLQLVGIFLEFNANS